MKLFKIDFNNEEIKSYSKFRIIANRIDPMDKYGEPKIEDSELNINSKIDNSTPMKLPEIDLEKIHEPLSLNRILKLFNDIIIGCRIFPAYLNTAIIKAKDNKEDLEYSSKYFDILYSIYKNVIKSTNNYSLIYLKINEFISSFQDMVIKLKNANIDFIHYQELNSIENKSHNQNSYITLPIKIESVRPKDEWNKEKSIEHQRRNKLYNIGNDINIHSEEKNDLEPIINNKPESKKSARITNYK